MKPQGRSDNSHFRFVIAMVGIAATVLPAHSLRASSLELATVRAWDAYVQAKIARMEQGPGAGKSFLWAGESGKRLAKVRSGEVVVASGAPDNPRRVPGGLIHDWIGAVFIPDVTLDNVMQVLRDYGKYQDLYRPTVVASRVISSGADDDRFTMLLAYRSMILKLAVATDNESKYVRLDDRRAYSISRATHIREIADYGEAGQHELREGEGVGAIWRLLSIGRYQERDGGVYYEVEAIGLSRDIPVSLRWIADPIVRRVAQESLATTLSKTDSAVRLLAASERRRHIVTASNQGRPAASGSN